jgi:hypothetical protein
MGPLMLMKRGFVRRITTVEKIPVVVKVAVSMQDAEGEAVRLWVRRFRGVVLVRGVCSAYHRARISLPGREAEKDPSRDRCH